MNKQNHKKSNPARKRPTISFILGDESKKFAIYSTNDVEAIYRDTELKNRFLFGLTVIFLDAHNYFQHVDCKPPVSLPDVKKKVYHLIIEDSLNNDIYPNFIEVFIIRYGNDGEMIHAPNYQAIVLDYANTYKKRFREVDIQFQTSDVIKLMKEYAEYYLRNQVVAKIKFWKENLTYVIHNLKTDLKNFFIDSINAELNRLEEYRNDFALPTSFLNHKFYLCPGIEWTGTEAELEKTKKFLSKYQVYFSDIIRWEVKYADKCNAVYLFDQFKNKDKIPRNIKDVTIISNILFIEESGEEHFLKAPNWSAHRSKMKANPPYYLPDPAFVSFASSL